MASRKHEHETTVGVLFPVGTGNWPPPKPSIETTAKQKPRRKTRPRNRVRRANPDLNRPLIW